MYQRFNFLLLILFGMNFCTTSQKNVSRLDPVHNTITKIDMDLNAFGVESDNFPSIEAHLDFQNDSNICVKSFYNPAYKDSIYHLNKTETQKILTLLKNLDLEKFKKEYSVASSDQPTSTIIIYTISNQYSIKDYGLQGDYPLQEIYKIVYKL